MREQLQGVYLDDQGEPVMLEDMQPEKNIVYSFDGEELPFDVKDKTLKELRQMGFKDILNFTVKHDPFKEGAQPYMPPEEKQRVLEQANELRRDINDPDFHFDPMGDDYDEQ